MLIELYIELIKINESVSESKLTHSPLTKVQDPTLPALLWSLGTARMISPTSPVLVPAANPTRPIPTSVRSQNLRQNTQTMVMTHPTHSPTLTLHCHPIPLVTLLMPCRHWPGARGRAPPCRKVGWSEGGGCPDTGSLPPWRRCQAHAPVDRRLSSPARLPRSPPNTCPRSPRTNCNKTQGITYFILCTMNYLLTFPFRLWSLSENHSLFSHFLSPCFPNYLNYKMIVCSSKQSF